MIMTIAGPFGPSDVVEIDTLFFKQLILETIMEANSISNEEIALLLTSDKSDERSMGELYMKWKTTRISG